MKRSASTTLFVLPPDVTVTPVAELSSQIRKKVGATGNEFAIGRPRARSVSKLVDGPGAQLLNVFRAPVTIAEAIAAYCGANGGDLRDVAVRAFPLLLECVNSGLLVPSDSDLAHAITPSLEPGSRIADARVIRCLMLANDTEVFEVREKRGLRRCLKIARVPCSSATASQFSREAAIVRHLQGSVTAALTRDGLIDGRPYLMMAWLEGIAPEMVAIRCRERSEPTSSRGLLALVRRVAEAYATLHSRGVLHGDVHTANILVTARQTVRLLDFGAGCFTSSSGRARPQRAGVAFYREPEYARAALETRPIPSVTAAGEQYSVAVLLYELVTGHHYLDFSLDEQLMLRQIAEEPPQSFAELGIRQWPELEGIFAKALNKHPSQRFRSMRQLADALSAVKVPRANASAVVRGSGISRFTESIVQRLAFDGPLFRDGFTTPPTSSVSVGTSGVAFALYRIACATDDPSLLALAEAWNAKALHALRKPGAFYNEDEGLTESVIGRSSLYHSSVGAHLVSASISHALGDTGTRNAAARELVRSAGQTGARLDLAFGKSGVLVASAMLLAMIERGDPTASVVLSFGRRTYRALTAAIAARPPIAENRRFVNLGMLHGWAGVLYAILRWCDASGTTPPAWLPRRLQELAALGARDGKGMRWPWRDQLNDSVKTMPGWCNGSAGFVHLWTLAHATFDDTRHLELAVHAGWSTWKGAGRAWDLCCGSAGRSYALLNLHRHTGDRVWLERAHQIANKAVGDARLAQRERGATYPYSLIRGVSGVAVLAEELNRVEDARMPMFELEPWPALGRSPR